MTNPSRTSCVFCGKGPVYRALTNANGGHGPALLRGLSRLFRPAMFEVYLCRECGHTEFVAGADERARIEEASHVWTKV